MTQNEYSTKPQHIHPGPPAINPIVIDDSYRSRKMKPNRCIWTYDETHDAYDTGCENKFQIMNGKPSENKMKFCPFCGKMIEEAEKRAGERG